MANDILDLYSERDPKRSRVSQGIRSFIELEASGAIVMLISAILAFVIANSPAYDWYHHLLETQLTVGAGSFQVSLSLELFINDVLMAIFFLIVGCEIKYEIMAGELADIKKASLPILAAVGGMLMPAAIYAITNTLPGASHPGGWGVPMATDIAFAIGILSLAGSRVPVSLKVFLTALAIVDDLGAIIVIAIFYSSGISFVWLGIGALIVLAMFVFNRLKGTSVSVYLLLGFALLVCCWYAGIHPTIAGVITALMLPVHSRVNPVSFSRWAHDRLERVEENYTADEPLIKNHELADTAQDLRVTSKYIVAPLTRVELIFSRASTYVILPLFAFANAGVRVIGIDPTVLLQDHAAWGTFFGLLLGKPLGITLICFAAVKLGISKLPQGVTWRSLIGTGVLAGIGFTMAIFVANLAFPSSPEITDVVKVSILFTSLCAGVIGFIWVKLSTRKNPQEQQ